MSARLLRPEQINVTRRPGDRRRQVLLRPCSEVGARAFQVLSASTYLASVGATGSAGLPLDPHVGRWSRRAVISPAMALSSSNSDAFKRRICLSSVRMLVTCPTPVGTPRKSR